MRVPIPADDPRTEERIRAHYEVERSLARQLREADKAERRSLYNTVYTDLYRLVPDHPLIRVAASTTDRDAQIAKLVRWVAPYMGPDRTFLEVGPGDCRFGFAVAARARHVYAVDVTDGIVDRAKMPANFTLAISDGTSIPVPSESVDLAFSDQLMEHLHPDDALDQLREIRRALKPGGTYLVCTPNRLTGPHDISQFFSATAQGMHLREYSNGDLAALLRELGFKRVRVGWPLRGRLVALPTLPFVMLERALELLPSKWRAALARKRLVRGLLGVRVLATR
jgi:SAM-dependent methyltransferase